MSGSALQLNGGSAGGYASLPAGIVSGLNDFTISAWVKPDALNNWARILDFGSGPKINMFLTARAGTTGNPLRFAITTTGAAGEQVVNGPALATGVWTHVAVTLAGSTATLYVNGRAYASNANVTLRPSSLGVTTSNYLGKSQYADPAFQGGIDDFRIYGKALSAADVMTLADVTPPQVAAGAFQYETSQSVALTFSEDVMASVDAGDLSVVNLATGVRVPASEFTLVKQGGAGAATTATWTHTGVLPDGNYRATLPAGGVADAAGNSLAADYTLDFFVLAGDITRDRVVNFDDLLILAKNYNKSGATYSQGDLDYNGTVNFDDLLILAKAYNNALPAPALVAPAAPALAPATPQALLLEADAETRAAPVFSTARIDTPVATRPKPAARTPRQIGGITGDAPRRRG